MTQREIIFDTETTGISPKENRLVEIGCVEMIGGILTGKTYHTYINPERDMPIGAYNVHGLSEEFLSDKPLFADVADDFLEFIGDAALVAHNAPFDMGFLNEELSNLGKEKLSNDRVTDTLIIARQKFPGSKVNLDALCRRFDIDNSKRTKHGALLDAELLAEVYIELMGGKQTGLSFDQETPSEEKELPHATAETADFKTNKSHREARAHTASEEEVAAHKAMLEKLTEPLWKTLS
ncbi:MAG: DNA polymerase III subunit epsilon [Alphaproteobacteria bacterium]